LPTAVTWRREQPAPLSRAPVQSSGRCAIPRQLAVEPVRSLRQLEISGAHFPKLLLLVGGVARIDRCGRALRGAPAQFFGRLILQHDGLLFRREREGRLSVIDAWIYLSMMESSLHPVMVVWLEKNLSAAVKPAPLEITRYRFAEKCDAHRVK
jgi:hypothetical protein